MRNILFLFNAKSFSVLVLWGVMVSCNQSQPILFKVNDTDFSKGRLGNQQNISLDDMVKFHGHMCDGLVVGALAFQETSKSLFPEGIIDRTNLRIVSNPSPCLTDVAVYLAGARYQFNTFSVDSNMKGIYILQRIDNGFTVEVTLKKGVKPSAIDSLGNLAIKGKLSPCGLDSLRVLEDAFTEQLFKSVPEEIFSVKKLDYFQWKVDTAHSYLKMDVLNKNAPLCNRE